MPKWYTQAARRAVVAAVVLGTFPLSACAGGDAAEEPDGPIKIGGTLGLTGALAGPAGEYKAIYDMWAAQVNKAGGISGRKVEMIIKNDDSTPATAQTLYQSLLTTDQVDILLAPYSTYVGTPIVPLARSGGKILFNGGFPSEPLSDEAKGWMVGTYPYMESQYTRGVFEAVKSLPADRRPSRVGILTLNNPFTLAVRDGHKGENGAIRYAEDAGMEVVYNEEYSSDTTDFTSAINSAKAARVELFLVLGLPEDSVRILRAAHTQQFAPKLTCACGSQVSTLPTWPEVGAATEGVLGTTTAWPSQGFEGLDELAALSRSRGEEVIPAYAIVAYSTLQVVQQAIAGAGTTDQDRLREYIYSHTFDTAVGKIKFNPNGTVPYSQVIVQTIGGKTFPIWPADLADHDLAVSR
ncbi:branched-chain amino acid transport system substrate-binding protein [Thermocatellispora tengchongensis]|uniref:Branched-chain amino acid transport system substrate-binding protein n=1 Tax=Thermocatellispora tengchongensis TaxID=1073253 RepID=A0A840PER8_9ACTN|nr:amino acid ABC transporter substrate-binding protein [Thermocatellispora tengchongensis]MBB5137256.1 branched-chain amino acid transport system substrate-binding protein [Thermocatellispora tengchongensis]